MIRRGQLLVLLGLIAGSLSAQEPWKSSNYPYLLSNGTDGLHLIMHVQYSQAADYFDRVPLAGSLSAEAGASTQGSRFGRVLFKAPRLVEGWRFVGEAHAIRQNRFGFFQSGDRLASPQAGALSSGPDLTDRVHRTRYGIRGEVTRTVTGPLQVALSLGVEHARFTDVPGPSVFRDTFGSERAETDAQGRFAIVLDLRDKEFVTANGLFLEGGVYTGSGGSGYHGGYAVARGYVSPREGTVLALRAGGRSLGGTPSLDAEYTIPTWERPIEVLGGVDTHRSFVNGRFHARHVLFGGFEARHDLINLGDFGAITLIGFVDAGRVFQGEFRLTTDDLEVGGGGGLAVRILRSTLLTFNFAGGPDGFLFSMGTGWSF